MWALSVPVRVGYVSYTYVLCERTSKQCAPRRSDHIHMLNMSMMHRTRPTFRPHGRPSPPQRHAGSLATASSIAGGIALAAAATSVAAAVRSRRSAARLAVPDRRPGRHRIMHRIRRSSPPPCAASSSAKPRCHRRGIPCACGRRQAGRRVGRQVKWTSERRSRAIIRGADRAQGSEKAGGVRRRVHTCSPRRPKSSLMMPYE